MMLAPTSTANTTATVPMNATTLPVANRTTESWALSIMASGTTSRSCSMKP